MISRNARKMFGVIICTIIGTAPALYIYFLFGESVLYHYGVGGSLILAVYLMYGIVVTAESKFISVDGFWLLICLSVLAHFGYIISQASLNIGLQIQYIGPLFAKEYSFTSFFASLVVLVFGVPTWAIAMAIPGAISAAYMFRKGIPG